MRRIETIGAAQQSERDDDIEQPELRLGFVALADCAPLVVAKERGFFRKQGLEVRLERQSSWANVRDKVAHGLLDGAQMLAPMPLAATLGLEGVTVPMVVPMGLSAGGNAVTVSSALYEQMAGLSPDVGLDRRGAVRALREIIVEGRRAGASPLRFAVVYPYSSHLYQLCYWLASAGIDPFRDVSLSVIPPARIVEALEHGEIDGYAVGEPWNQLAVDLEIGVPLVTSNEIWQSSPEKVLAVTEEFADRNPHTVRALLRALLEASIWLDRDENRLEAVHVIAGESHVDAPVETIAASMVGTFDSGPNASSARTQHHFHRSAATFPWVSHAMWFLTQMLRWGQVEKAFPLEALASKVYRPDLYRDAAEDLGVDFPEVDAKIEGTHEVAWRVERASSPIEMGADRFMDGRVFRPDEPVAYLEGFEVSALRVRLDDLALANA